MDCIDHCVNRNVTSWNRRNANVGSWIIHCGYFPMVDCINTMERPCTGSIKWCRIIIFN